MGHAKNNEAFPKSTYQWHWFGSVFCTGVYFLAHLCLGTVGSYALLSVRLSVRPSITGPKFRLENNSLSAAICVQA